MEQKSKCKLCLTIQNAEQIGCFLFCDHIICKQCAIYIEECARNIKETLYNHIKKEVVDNIIMNLDF